MLLSNLERLIQLADNVFAAKSDPDQLDVDWQVLERLRKIHPLTVSDFDEGMGPVAWVLLIPTTKVYIPVNLTPVFRAMLTPLWVDEEQ